MSWYATAKVVHVVCVTLSLSGFIARFALARRGSVLCSHPAVRVAPHVNDTLLLGAAVTMLVLARLDPVSLPWLSAKILGLVVYIVLGMVALRHGKTPRCRAIAFAAALVSFGYVASVALTRSPLGAGAWLSQ